MKLVDYLAKRMRYKELLRQLKEVKYSYEINSLVYDDLWNDKLKQSCVKKSTKLMKKIVMLEQELRELFKE